MNPIGKKCLVHFGAIDCDISQLDKETIEYIRQRFPSVLADIYRKANLKDKAIQALQNKLAGGSKAVYTHEILYNYIYFEDYCGALQRIASLDFRDQTIECLSLQIFIHQKTLNEKVSCRSEAYNEINSRVLKYLFMHFNIDVFSYFRKALNEFCNNNKECKDKSCGDLKIALFKSHCNRKYLEKLCLKSLEYIYNELDLPEALRLMVHRNPKINEFYLREFARRCLPANEEIKSILERAYSPSLFDLLKRRGSLTKQIVKLKKYYREDYSEKKVKFESSYCKRVRKSRKEEYLKIYTMPEKVRKSNKKK
ncbi:hypothetical protein [Encephalitozoon cuniculi GB-M1]|uniref:Uncharacterized protein n=2 Tax=Encephalitozoon cuniculi TaxID=6035 RepID=Q8SVG9_ENCCU|nr:uncharacterized protein ECU05_1410 [Encephalitozoon cuniculi GB-M1]AGE95424.1 hypothetical protein ECU05_1410 [Encephalitozoon cuniculi]KMV66198.1 hypothetical protein M970_051420 [Encephalitozoon cuniculi EcunIII-L]UYI27938.1 hypothetical protein J0A71_08g18280 [Encephalitozoon cuniculi]CAD26661.1 hypothetical protein [Encephalitozoon cuniculi GB-M1]